MNTCFRFRAGYWDADIQQGSDAHYTYTNELSGNGQTFSYSGASTRTFLNCTGIRISTEDRAEMGDRTIKSRSVPFHAGQHQL